MHTVQLAARHRQIARHFRAARQNQRIILGFQFSRRDGDADMCVIMEGDAFGLHLLDAAINAVFFHFEIGNAIAQQATGFGVFFIKMHIMTGARQLLRCRHAGRTGTDNAYAFAGFMARHLRDNPAFFPALIDNCAFDRFNGHGIIVNIQRARGLARGRANAAGKFGEIIGRVQIGQRRLPIARIDKVVPIRNLIIDRTAIMAIGHAAIHAARGLCFQIRLIQRHDELAKVLHPLFFRQIASVLAIQFKKSGRFSHFTLLRQAGRQCPRQPVH